MLSFFLEFFFVIINSHYCIILFQMKLRVTTRQMNGNVVLAAAETSKILWWI